MPRIAAKDRVRLFKEAIKNGMVLLPYDIETSHLKVKVFHIGRDCHINHTQITEPSQVISIQYMLPGMTKAKYLEWNSTGKGQHDDSSMIEEFSTSIFSKADIVLGQNSDNFDYKTLNDRAMVLGLSPFDQKPSIDILKLSRKSFKASSHKLDFRSYRIGLGGKMRMMEQDWFDVEEDKVPVSRKMGPYGCKDVEDTLKVFWKELPYYKDLPVAVEKVVLSFVNPTTVKKKYCKVCARSKHRKFDIKQVSGGSYECKNCGSRKIGEV